MDNDKNENKEDLIQNPTASQLREDNLEFNRSQYEYLQIDLDKEIKEANKRLS